jgi:hypothetical protein
MDTSFFALHLSAALKCLPRQDTGQAQPLISQEYSSFARKSVSAARMLNSENQSTPTKDMMPEGSAWLRKFYGVSPFLPTGPTIGLRKGFSNLRRDTVLQENGLAVYDTSV